MDVGSTLVVGQDVGIGGLMAQKRGIGIDVGGPERRSFSRNHAVESGVIAPVPGIMRLFWAFSPSTPPESPSQEDSSLANMLDTLEARCRSDGPPAGPRSIDPLPGSRSFLTVSAVA